ncbi:MAG: hypothetical protein NZ937_06860 [Armatimonadetes bacterium]|nr:hypothetical protein [Armatimonadota bacterium]
MKGTVALLIGLAIVSSNCGFGQGLKAISLPIATPKLKPQTDFTTWQKQKFGVLTTELSPSVLVLCRTKVLHLFRNMERWGLEPPTFIAIPTREGVQIFQRNKFTLLPMNEAWLLCWFNGAKGWRYDAPTLLVLQRKPSEISITEEGLTLKFPKEAGFIVIMPLFGYFKVPMNREGDYLAQHRLLSRGIATNTWVSNLPKPVIERCRFFARMLRMFPIHCKEEFTVDGDTILVRYSFSYLPIADEWRTKPIKFAPLPPVLALAHWSGVRVAEKPFPMEFSQPIRDVDLFTPYGPFMGVENKNSYTVKMRVLHHVHFAEKWQPPETKRHPSVAAALKRLENTLAQKFRTKSWQQIWDHGGPENYCWQVMGDRWYAKALPYLPKDLQERVKTVLVDYLREFVLQEGNYKSFRSMLLLVGPGIGTWGSYDDAGKFSSNLLETVWNIAYYAGGWEIIRQRWQTVKRFFITPLECDWKSVGRYAIAEMGDEAAPPLSMARLAYQVGDYETYAFACYIFARELVHHYVKQVGASYFRLNQPWHSEEFMPEEVYLTNLWGDLAGWQIDGPTYPKVTGERQFNNRWVRFSCEEVAWFYQGVLHSEVSAEMDLLTERAKRQKGEEETPYRLLQDTAHIAPSIVRLRALLLNEPPEKLATIAPPESWQVGRGADVAAMCVSFLRTSRPVQRVRLIPPIKTNFALGLERAREFSEYPALALTAEASMAKELPEKMRGYPFLRWWGWRAPKAVSGIQWGESWSFGQIVPEGFAVKQAEAKRLNWNTVVWFFEL